MERRRVQAAEVFAQGKTRAEVAGQLGVSAQTTSRWHVRWRAGDLHTWAATQPWLELAYLPSYAPELDPVEGCGPNLKGRELANRCCADRRELIATAQVGSIRARRDPDLLRSFLAGTGLTI